MRRTSLATYNEIKESGLLSKKRMMVYEYLYKHGPLTGGQLQKALGGGVSESIRNRVTELVKMGAVYEVCEVDCPVTGRKVIQFDVSGNMPKDYEKPKTKNQIIKELNDEITELKKNLQWAVDTANYWVDNISDKQKCVDLAYKYNFKLDHEESRWNN